MKFLLRSKDNVEHQIRSAGGITKAVKNIANSSLQPALYQRLRRLKGIRSLGRVKDDLPV